MVKLLLERFDVVGDGILRGYCIVGIVEPCEDGVECAIEASDAHLTTAVSLTAHRRLNMHSHVHTSLTIISK